MSFSAVLAAEAIILVVSRCQLPLLLMLLLMPLGETVIMLEWNEKAVTAPEKDDDDVAMMAANARAKNIDISLSLLSF